MPTVAIAAAAAEEGEENGEDVCRETIIRYIWTKKLVVNSSRFLELLKCRKVKNYVHCRCSILLRVSP
jgi:hypothetical protein